MQKLSVVVLALVMLAASALPLQSQQTKHLVQHWSPRLHQQLAQCFIAESDEGSDDWTAVAFTMRNWLKVRQRRWPTLRYIDIVNTVCSVHKLDVDNLTSRQAWIKNLTFPTVGEDGARFIRKPQGFPTNSSWERKQHYWLEALKHAKRWYLGELKDPCKGQAVLWGAPSNPDNRWYLRTDDPLLKGMKVVRLDCSNSLSNDFYRLMTRSERDEYESQRLAQGEDARAGGDDSCPGC